MPPLTAHFSRQVGLRFNAYPSGPEVRAMRPLQGSGCSDHAGHSDRGLGDRWDYVRVKLAAI